VCDLETSRMGAPYIYDISHLRVNTIVLLRMSTWLLETCRGFKYTYHRRNCASSWLPTRIIQRCTVRKIYLKKSFGLCLCWIVTECL